MFLTSRPKDSKSELTEEGPDHPPPKKADRLFGPAYEQLRRMARRERGSASGHTLNTTALVHEVFLKLCGKKSPEFSHVAQFLSYSARAMRHVLIDRALRRMRPKLGGDAAHVDLSDPDAGRIGMDPGEAMQLDSALRELERQDARAARVVELHYFAGMELEQVAEVLGVSLRTVERDWRYARAYLKTEMQS